jgi:protein-S-isoprenylcysteine O-methyltransferase Ste14
MYIWFFIWVLAIILIIPLYFLSVSHQKLQDKFGKEKGLVIAKIFGYISGWGFFICLFGIWLSSQPKFRIPFLEKIWISLPIINLSISVFHFIISVPIIMFGAWFGIVGVKGTTLKVAETHNPEKVINTGIYSKIRHPQYFGAILSHVGISLLLSAFFSLLATPLVLFLIYLISWKEEKELIREFGIDYEGYKKVVPMFIPKLKNRK